MTAEHREHERQTVAVDPGHDTPRRLELGGRHQRLDLDEQRSRPLHRAQDDAAGGPRRLGHEPRRGVEDLHQAVVAHLEHTDLVGRSKAVLDRAHGPVGALAVALELQHAVDQVLETRGPASAPSLVTWPTRRHGDSVGLGDAHHLGRDLAHLRDRAGGAGQLGRSGASAPSRSRTPPAARARASRTRVEVGLRDHRDLQRAPAVRRSARNRIWAGDSSADT